MKPAASIALIRTLQEKVHDMEGHAAQTVGPCVLASGSPIDGLLPRRGWRRGVLTEWLGEGDGAGALTLALAQSASLVRLTGILVVVDRQRCFYPPAAARLGIDLKRTVIVQPRTPSEALWALEQALRSTAGAVTLGCFDRLEERSYRRLQLAAEAGGSVGMLVRPARFRAEPSWAEVRLLATPRPAKPSAPGRCWKVEVLHCRGGRNGGAVEVELTDEANLVRMVSGLAHSAHQADAASA